LLLTSDEDIELPKATMLDACRNRSEYTE